jgi:hypothetical protein
VTIGAATLERAVFWLVAPASHGPQLLPAMLEEAASGTPGPYLHEFADTLSVAPPLCVGYVPKCDTGVRMALGSTLSGMCPITADEKAWSAACGAWQARRSRTKVEPLVGVPTLALFGSHNPFAAPAYVRARLAELVPDAFVVEYAAGGHNVLGSECPRSVRTAWLAGDVHDPPPDLACMSDPIDFPH